jgi:hypothetical protein
MSFLHGHRKLATILGLASFAYLANFIDDPFFSFFFLDPIGLLPHSNFSWPYDSPKNPYILAINPSINCLIYVNMGKKMEEELLAIFWR